MTSNSLTNMPQRTGRTNQTTASTGMATWLIRAVCKVFYGEAPSVEGRQRKVHLFGLGIDNLTMTEAVRWTVSPKAKNSPRRIAFVNVNSIEQCAKNRTLYKNLRQADLRFADGSGMRVAARKAGSPLVDNVNGTDMLPLLCEQCEKQGLSLFLFGAQSGVAKKMAHNLTARYPALRIAGTESGYTPAAQYPQLIARINRSMPDIVLVALGTPHQEKWLASHAEHLQCRTVLAVGGLFDFYSGQIPRAPIWMRELGMEWVWRLCQEPVAKGYRYLVGNPRFLLRLFFTDQVKRGF